MTQVSTCHQVTTTSASGVDERRNAPDERRNAPDQRRNAAVKRWDTSDEPWDDRDAGWELSWIKSYVNGKHREYYRTAATR